MKWALAGGAVLAIGVMALVASVMKARTPSSTGGGAVTAIPSLEALAAPSGAAAAATPRVDLAFVILSEEKIPEAATVVSAFPGFATPGQVLTARPGGAGKPVLEFELEPCGEAFVALMGAPYPNNEADEMVQFSASALGTGWSLPAQKAHLVVTLRSKASAPPRVTSLSCLTSLVAAVVRSSPAVGVYWSEARATHNPEFFMSTAQSPTLLPRITLWSGVSLARDGDDRVSLLSLGMKQLGLPDLLVIAPRAKSQGAMPALFEVLARMVEHEARFGDGEIVVYGDGHKATIGYVRSPIDATKKVARFELK